MRERLLEKGGCVRTSVCCLWLAAGFLALLGCATVPVKPPVTSEPYAVLAFPASMRLLAVDEQPVASRSRLAMLRVHPGQHTLRFVHVNAGIDGSAEHAGQFADPFKLDVQEGLIYHFESKT
jgi:hypothetical protein